MSNLYEILEGCKEKRRSVKEEGDMGRLENFIRMLRRGAEECDESDIKVENNDVLDEEIARELQENIDVTEETEKVGKLREKLMMGLKKVPKKSAISAVGVEIAMDAAEKKKLSPMQYWLKFGRAPKGYSYDTKMHRLIPSMG